MVVTHRNHRTLTGSGSLVWFILSVLFSWGICRQTYPIQGLSAELREGKDSWFWCAPCTYIEQKSIGKRAFHLFLSQIYFSPSVCKISYRKATTPLQGDAVGSYKKRHSDETGLIALHSALPIAHSVAYVRWATRITTLGRKCLVWSSCRAFWNFLWVAEL